jgi:DNA-binding NtrC family response regulator
LENRIQQAVVMCNTGIIYPKDLVLSQENNEHEPNNSTGKTNIYKEPFSQAKKALILSFEREYLTRLLAQFKGDMVRAAAKAGKSRTALWNLITKHNLHPKQFSQDL